MKTFAVLSAVAFALPAFAAPTGPTPAGVTPIASPQNQCQVTYNSCIASGTPEVMCSCDMTACFGEDAARIREWCASKTSTLTRVSPIATPTAPVIYSCAQQDTDCRKPGADGLSANQAQCSANTAQCNGACEISYNECRTEPDANMSFCASKYASCLGTNPFAQTTTTASATPTPAPVATDCVSKNNACRQSGPDGLSANQAQCSANDAACKGACDDTYDACRVAPDANMSFCASNYAGCLGTNPFAEPPANATAPASAFGGLAIHSGSRIQYASVNAAGRTFWLLKDSSVYCPDVVGSACSNTTSTQFVGGNNTLSLETVVPGGQQVFVAADGTLSYTAPHSASTGEGSFVTGFSIAQEGQHIQFQGKDFLACPVGDSYAVFASAIKQDTSGACYDFAFRIADSSLPAAWEYA